MIRKKILVSRINIVLYLIEEIKRDIRENPKEEDMKLLGVMSEIRGILKGER